MNLLTDGFDDTSVEDVVARCAIETDALFGIRMELGTPGRWIATSTYRLARMARSGQPADAQAGTPSRRVTGSISLGQSYRGCPCCTATGLVVCGCGEMACFAGRSGDVHTCPWCGAAGPVEGEITRFGVVGGASASDQTDAPADDLMEAPWWES